MVTEQNMRTECWGDAVTDDWVEFMSDPVEQDGVFALMVEVGILPQGVNPEDPRVMAICATIRERQR